MPVNVKSLQAKLYNISKENGVPFQLLLNQFGAEQFLARLSRSPNAKRFIFKGGTLLAYLIDTTRKTKDLDFSIRELRSDRPDHLLSVIEEILNIDLDDGLAWEKPTGETLRHPEMDYPGMRVKCPFHLETMRGHVRIDLAFGDVVDAVEFALEKLRYKGEPLVGQDFMVLSYPPESIFSEKLQIVISRKENNTRMKDYYDLYKLALGALDETKLRTCVQVTFEKRGVAVQQEIDFHPDAVQKLQTFWSAYLTKATLADVPQQIKEVIEAINKTLENIFRG